jgi:DNA-binding CsgD family transcriptional regulator
METPIIRIAGEEITLRQAQYISMIMQDISMNAVGDFFGVKESAIYGNLKMLRGKLGTSSCIGLVLKAMQSGFDLEGNYGNFYLFADYPGVTWPYNAKAA